MNTKKTVLEQLDDVRRYVFISLAPLYLIASGFTMEVALRNAHTGQTMSSVTYGIISGAFMIITIWLVCVAFFIRQEKIEFWTYEIFARISLLAALIFVIGLLGVMKRLLDAGVGGLYLTAFIIFGYLLYFAILAFEIFTIFKQGRRRIKNPLAV